MSSNGGNLTIQYNLRWSEEMRDKIAAAAKENTRSMNQEIIARLEQSFNFEEKEAQGNIIISSNSQKILSENLQKTISKLITKLIEEGVDPVSILKASNSLKSKD